MIRARKYIKEKCSVICFTYNYRNQEGSNHPALWAHYADDSNGVCIVIDKQSLIENNKELLERYFYKFDKVRYTSMCQPKIKSIKSLNETEFIHKYYKELFFKKHLDWSYEREDRFLIEAPEIYLNIRGAIKHIVLGGRLKENDENIQQILTEIITPGTKSYKYFNISSFAESTTSPYNYTTHMSNDILFSMLRKMNQNADLVKSYISWHNTEYKTSI